MIPSPRPGRLRRSILTALPLLLGLATALPARRAEAQQALFGAQELDQLRFVLVAAPIGSSGTRYQLNIYEQVTDRRPCFATTSTLPAPVNPLLATFDFTGICGRYIDANGYSLRVGGSDLATSYRLMVRTDPSGSLLVALPTKDGAGPEMIVARSGGPIGGFHKLQPEPGWRLMRRTYAGRRLGHLYVYNDSWPLADGVVGGAAAVTPAASTPQPAGSGSKGTSATPPAAAGPAAGQTGPVIGTPKTGSTGTTPATTPAPAAATPAAAGGPPLPPPRL